MRRFIVSMITTVDGYHEGPGRDVMAMPFDDGFSRANVELLRGTGTILQGSATWDGGAHWTGVAADDSQPAIEREIGRINAEVEHLIVSDSLRVDPTWPWASRTRIIRRAEAVDELRRMKAQEGGDILTFGSAITWNPLLEAGVVDELHVLIGPALLGDGTKVFSGSRTPLRLLDAGVLPGSQLVRLRYDASGA